MFSINDIQFSLLFLYAETHYRFFPFFPSLLFKSEPEVLFDVPHRLNPGEDLPVLLILNDTDRFPVNASSVTVTVSQPGNGTQRFDFTDCHDFLISHPMQKHQSAFLFFIPREKIPTGELFINATVTLTSSKKQFIVFNDNITGSSRQAFRCLSSANMLPGSELCEYGDLHVHSHFSQSHVEFGAPLAIIDRMAKCCGLSFIGITDHSYDLSCKMSCYLEEDEKLERWKLLKQSLKNTEAFSTIMIPGEELSCANSSGETIHLAGLGHSTFLPGSMDGARRHLFFKKQMSINEAVTQIHQQDGIAFAAHPCSKSGFLQKLLLHRGNWQKNDFNNSLDGIQILNSGFTKSWIKGKSLWIDLLLQGLRIPLLAGNDAHGDFSRYRAIKTPFLSIYENFKRYMGYAKTGIYGKCSSQSEIFSQIRKGATFVTTGPYISINYSTNPKDCAFSLSPNRTLRTNTCNLHALSSSEFGTIRKITLFSGNPGVNNGLEHTVFTKSLQKWSFEEIIPFSCSDIAEGNYIRAEIESVTPDGVTNKAFTSAIFFD